MSEVTETIEVADEAAVEPAVAAAQVQPQMRFMGNDRLRELQAEWGTPSFVFDTAAFKSRLQTCQQIVGSDIALCFAMKANPFLTAAAAQVGVHLEVCSPGELAICEQLGVDPALVVYSGVNKEISDITEAATFGAGVMTAESLLHAAYLSEVAVSRNQVIDVLPRLNSGSQFGMSKEDLLWLVDNRSEFPGINLVGIHYFVGTQRKKLKHQRRELASLIEFLDLLEAEHDFTVERFEYGPGLAVPYFVDDDFSDDLAPLRELAPDLQEVAKRVKLTIEMGRFFAAPCGAYLTRAMDLKSNDGTNYAILDGGMNHLTYYGQMMGLHVPVIANLTAQVSDPATRTDGSREWCLCGSLCTVNDVLVRSVEMNSLERGDVLAFKNAGAYSVTEGVHLFLSRTMPRVLLCDGEDVRLARDFTESWPINCAHL